MALQCRGKLAVAEQKKKGVLRFKLNMVVVCCQLLTLLFRTGDALVCVAEHLEHAHW